jgi:hypothetical protein
MGRSAVAVLPSGRVSVQASGTVAAASGAA